MPSCENDAWKIIEQLQKSGHSVTIKAERFSGFMVIVNIFENNNQSFATRQFMRKGDNLFFLICQIAEEVASRKDRPREIVNA